MSPIDLIKQGIISQNWNDIKEAYKLLTGIEVTDYEPKPLKKKPGRKPKTILHPVDDKDTSVLIKKEEPKNAFRNLFVDDGTLCREDKKIDKKLNGKLVKTKRRQKAKEYQIKKKCTVCGKQFIAYNDIEYRCDRCM